MSRTLECREDGRKTLRCTAAVPGTAVNSWSTAGRSWKTMTELPHNSRPGLLPGNAQVTRSMAVQCIHCHALTSASPASPAVPSPSQLRSSLGHSQGPVSVLKLAPFGPFGAVLVDVANSRCGHRMGCRHLSYGPARNVIYPLVQLTVGTPPCAPARRLLQLPDAALHA